MSSPKILLSALLSPRPYRRQEIISTGSESELSTDGDVKAGEIFILNQNGETALEKRAHLKVVKEDANRFSARFYTDADETFQVGLLRVEKCKVSLSTSDLRVIQVTKDEEDDNSQGMLIKAKSADDAREWVRAMSPQTRKDAD